MEQTILNFTANGQMLTQSNGTHFASDTINYIGAVFDLQNNWDSFDSVRAVWFNDFNTISTVLDSDGACTVPMEVLKRKGKVFVNLVGSVVSGDTVTDRLTTYPINAICIDAKAMVTGSETAEITASQFEQYVAAVQSLVATVKDIDSVVLNADYTLTINFSDGTSTTTTSIRGAQGETGATGNGIQSIYQTGQSGLNPQIDEYTILFTDGTTTTFTVTNGVKGDTGATGNGIASVAKTSTSGLVDTYTITFTDGTTTTFTVTNGQNADALLRSAMPQDTASGSIASFPDGSDLFDAISVVVDIEPQQDLNGQDAPYPSGGGKNLFDISGATTSTDSGVTYTINADGTVSLSGIASGNSYKKLGSITLESGTYVLSGGYSANIYLNLQAPAYYSNPDAVTFTVSAETTFDLYANVKNGTNASGTTLKPMVCLLSASNPDTYAPYSNICPISGWASAKVYRTGVNVWDEVWESGDLEGASGTEIESSSYIRSANFIPCKPNTEYLIKSDSRSWAFWFDSNKQYISHAGGTVSSGSVKTSPSNAAYVRITSNQGSYNNSVAFNYPSTDTDYHAYNGHTYTIDLDGTRYGGTLDVVSGVMTVDRAMHTFDGTDTVGLANWRPLDNSSAWLYAPSITQGMTSVQTSSANLSDVISDTLGTVAYYNIYSDDTAGISNVGSATWGIAMRVADTSLRTESAINAWLAENPITVVYELATPTTVQLTPQQVDLLLGDNNVWADTGDTEVTYKADIQRYIAKVINA